MPCYAELATTTNFSFLRGASHPEELVARALELGHCGIGIADRNSVAGIVRAFSYLRAHGVKAFSSEVDADLRKECPSRLENSEGDRFNLNRTRFAFKLAVGVHLVFRDETPDILCYPKDRAAYGRLCRLLTKGNCRAAKGDCALYLDDLLEFGEGHQLIVMENGALPPALTVAFRGRLWIAASALYGAGARAQLQRRIALAGEHALPLIAVNNVLMHVNERRPLADALACIREGITLDEAGLLLEANAERHLKDAEEMARIFAKAPQAIDETRRFLDGLAFRLSDLAYDYPTELREEFESEQQALEHFARAGAKKRYPNGVPPHVEALLEYEMKLIGQLNYAAYFLTVHEIVRFARSRGILAQGRGSSGK